MPEGPEIRRAADRIAAAITGQPLHTVWFGLQQLRRFESTLLNSTVVSVNTKGKALLTEFDCGLTVYSHNQLYGRWFIMPAGERPTTNRQLRWLIETQKHAALLYSASAIEVLPTAAVQRHPFVARAGLDVLTDVPDAATLQTFISQPRFYRRALGSLLLDQSFIAGSGNYLRSEILFSARLAPERKLASLDVQEIKRLARQIIIITRRAYRTGGITIDPMRTRALRARGWSFGRRRHFVFGREGQPCHVCGTTVQKAQVAGRRLYSCPRCQPGSSAAE
jgi:endonuclease-8